jgi:hypothetical protein
MRTEKIYKNHMIIIKKPGVLILQIRELLMDILRSKK